MPEWQQEELDKRYSDYKNGKLKIHDWKGVHEKLRNKYKPSMAEFDSIILHARRKAKSAGMKKSDISASIARVRAQK